MDWKQYEQDLREALLKLTPTGGEGFEGLIAATLTSITEVPFRLAGSGSQFGVDAKPAYEDDSICFEAKRYDGQIPREKVLSKVAELSISDSSNIDLWVLGATSSITSQLADDVYKLGGQKGIAILILDWSSVDLSPLGVALAMAETKSAEFLDNHLDDKKLAALARIALKAIRDNKAFSEHSARIHAKLNEPATGIGIARRANTKWLNNVFSDRQLARRFLGQPLSPIASGGTPLTRSSLVSQITPFISGSPDDSVVIVLGEEGNGKSWCVAQSWLSLEEKALMVVLTPDDFIQIKSSDNTTNLVIRKLVQQTEGQLSVEVDERWRRKLARWRSQDTPDVARLVVLIDGLNQRPELDWARLLDALASDMCGIGGRLIVTVRTPYFRGSNGTTAAHARHRDQDSRMD